MHDNHANYSQELAGLKKQLDDMDTKLNDLTTSFNALTRGNGRQGYYTVLDDVYGPRDRSRTGVIERLVKAEHEVSSLKTRGKEIIVYLRGLAAGIALVGVDILFGFNLVSAIRSVFGS